MPGLPIYARWPWVATGLEAGRELGIIHCDIKPANILLTSDGTVKIVDFGLAQRMTSRVTSKSSESNIEGTLAYMSPEQFDDSRRVDHRTDIYAIGITSIQLITGQLPLRGKNSRELIFSKMSAPTTLAHELSPEIPSSVSDWIVKLTSKNPEGRPASYAEVRGQIRKLLELVGGVR